MVKLAPKALVDELVETFAEDVGFPDFFRALLELLKKIINKLFGLALGAHERCNLRGYICLYHMY